MNVGFHGSGYVSENNGGLVVRHRRDLERDTSDVKGERQKSIGLGDDLSLGPGCPVYEPTRENSQEFRWDTRGT